jgi:anti-sigma regulatory factor (Ser/Thr protein kinase)
VRDADDLRERGLGRGLVDQVLADQVDVEAGAHGEQQASLVHFAVRRRDHHQQHLYHLQKTTRHTMN